ncbi:MAG: hypothetical protein JXO22_00240, partial [Phycisphaerae bacterium]|nr:hypothetical protein [Phycisphaerae bacterium]
PTRAKRMMADVLGSEWGRLFRGWEKTKADENGYPEIGAAPAELKRTGWAAFAKSFKILGTCVKEAPEVAMRRRRTCTKLTSSRGANGE